MAAQQPFPRSSGLHHIGLEHYELERERLADLGFEVRGGEHPFMPVAAQTLTSN